MRRPIHLEVGIDHNTANPRNPPEGYLNRQEWASALLRRGLKQYRCDNCSVYLFPGQPHRCALPRCGSA